MAFLKENTHTVIPPTLGGTEVSYTARDMGGKEGDGTAGPPGGCYFSDGIFTINDMMVFACINARSAVMEAG